MVDKKDFKKADLHVHTPNSLCYNAKVKAQDIVEAAVKAGLDILAITDHNSVDGINEIRTSAEEKSLTIIPGVEITTVNGHFIALFDLDVSKKEMEDFLDYIGIDKNGRGDAHTVASDETGVVLRKIHERGGIAIAAHIDRWPSGFLETKITRRQKREIHENEYLDALEITIPQTKQAWNNGEVRDFPMKRACVQGSDAHNPVEIARRPVYIRMNKVGLEELKKALIEYKTCILFPENDSIEK
jgi:predicted metal-dependent phosphoesterase TrpH